MIIFMSYCHVFLSLSSQPISQGCNKPVAPDLWTQLSYYWYTWTTTGVTSWCVWTQRSQIVTLLVGDTVHLIIAPSWKILSKQNKTKTCAYLTPCGLLMRWYNWSIFVPVMACWLTASIYYLHYHHHWGLKASTCREISQEMINISTLDMTLEINYSRLCLHIPGANQTMWHTIYKLRSVQNTGTCYPGQGWFVRNLGWGR